MASGIYRLTPKEVESLGKLGRYADGGGLYLWVRPSKRAKAEAGAAAVVKSWLVRLQKDKQLRDRGGAGLCRAMSGGGPTSGRDLASGGWGGYGGPGLRLA